MRATMTLLLLLVSACAAAQGSLYDRNLKANWDALWDVGAEGAWGRPNTRPEVRLNYHRQAVITSARQNAAKMIAQWGWDQDSTVLIVFCGFGWIVEALIEQGVGAVVCVEQSAYIQASKGENEDADLRAAVEAVGLVTNAGDGLAIFNALRNGGAPRSGAAAAIRDESLSTKDSRDRIANALPGNNIHAVTYDGWLQTYTDTEALELSGRLNSIRGVRQVSHWVYFGDEWAPGVQSKSQAEWQALIPADEFVQL